MKQIKFSQEEKEFIRATKDLLKSDSESSVFIRWIVEYAAEVLDYRGVYTNRHNLTLISKLCINPDIKALVWLKNNPQFCPNCGTRLTGECGRLICPECSKQYKDEHEFKNKFFIENELTRAQCEKCSSYVDPESPDFEKRVFEGFSPGCPGVFKKGNQVEDLQKKLKVNVKDMRFDRARELRRKREDKQNSIISDKFNEKYTNERK